jgi:DNA-binding beta-propeller fold protein YncE
VSGPGDGVEGLHDPPTGELDAGAIAAAGRGGTNGPAAVDRRFLSGVAGHDAADRFSRRGGATTRWITPMVGGPVDDASYLRALLGNLYFLLPIVGMVLGLVAGHSTSGQAVPPSLDLTLVLIALGAFDALSGLCALAGFTLVTLFTGNLIGSHMGTAQPGVQTAVYTLTGLFGLGVLWFAGGMVARRLRPYRAVRGGSSASVWARRLVDYAAVPIVGTIVIWVAALEMPVLTGNGPQELFVTIQDHLLTVKIVALVALTARALLQGAVTYHFEHRNEVVRPEESRTRPLLFAILFWAIRGAFGFMILWEALGFVWETWACLILLQAMGPAAWAGRRLWRWTMTYLAFPLVIVRMIVVILCAQFVLTMVMSREVNPTPMLGIVLVTIGILLVLSAFLDHPLGVGRRRDWRTAAADGVALVLLVLIVQGVLGFTATPFNSPHGVFVAPTGSVFVADTGNNRVVLVWKGGYRQTLGTGLLRPADVVGDPGPVGWVFIADAGNDRIVALSGLHGYTVGDPSFSYALADGAIGQHSLGVGLKDPQSVSVDGDGDLFVADTGNNRIVELHEGAFWTTQTTFLRGHDLSHPLAVLCDPFYTGAVYIANTGGGSVLEVTPKGKVKVLLRGLHEPAGLAMDPWGNLYVSEMGNGKVLEVPNKGLGTPHVIASGLGQPRGISVDALGDVFVANSANGQVQVVATLREHRLMTHGIPDPSAVGIARHGVWVVDRAQGWLQQFVHGTLRTVATGLKGAVGVAAGPHGDAWVDLQGGQLVLVAPNGSWHVVVRGLDGPRQLYPSPTGTGGVLVAEQGKGEILAVAPDGATKVLLAHLNSPDSVAADAFGTVVVGLKDGNVYQFSAKATEKVKVKVKVRGKEIVEVRREPRPEFLFNVLGITSIGIDGRGNAFVASARYRLVIEHVAATGRDAVVVRDFRSLSGMAITSQDVMWVADLRSIGLWKVVPTHFFTQL